MYLASADEMRAIDKKAMDEYGIAGILLMEAAAAHGARVVRQQLQARGTVKVVTGAGNNGGDGWAIARHLAAEGLDVSVITAVTPCQLKDDALRQFEIYDNYGLAWAEYVSPEQLDGALIVDALLGTGIRGQVRGLAAEIISAINACTAPVLAVDIPSGLSGDVVASQGEVVQAVATATFGLAKAGLYTPTGRQAAGKIFVDAIGLPRELLRTRLWINDIQQAVKGLAPRPLDGHKGSFGHGLLVAGSQGMSGAAILAGKSALRAGIGLLTVAGPQQISQVLATNLWEALTLPLADSEGAFAATAQVDVYKFAAAAVGPGCGTGAGTQALVRQLVQSSLPLVVDADGLNVLAPGVPIRQAPTIISPHPGEMARLLGSNTEDVVAAPLAAARRAAEQWQCVVLLKGSSTYIVSPDGRAAVNITGTNGLATGGSGDLLTGLLLGLLGRGGDPFAVACAAAWVLGTASELAGQQLGLTAQLPRDVLTYIPGAFVQLEDIST